MGENGRERVERCVAELVETICDEVRVPKSLPAAVITLVKQKNEQKTARRYKVSRFTYAVRFVLAKSASERDLCDIVERARERFVAEFGEDIEEIEFYWSLADTRDVRVAKFEVSV